MRFSSSKPLWLLMVGASTVLAGFEEFSFAGNGGNSSAVRKCGTGVGSLPYGCDPPAMCSQDTLTRKWYCCNPGESDATCWTGASKCEGTPTQSTNAPSSQQTGCTVGNVNFCCLAQNEKCTQVIGQFNICWSNFDNALRPLNKTRLNETFQSLSRASPSASVYSVPRAQLNGYTSTTPGASSATSVSPSSTSPGTSTSSAPASNGGGGLSGGAIGGIVGGVVGGLALLGAVGFFFWRRKRAQGKTNPHAPPTDPYQGYQYQQQYQPQPQYSPQPPVAQMHSPPPTDKYAHMQQPQVAEAPAYNGPVEMDASYYQQHGGHK